MEIEKNIKKTSKSKKKNTSKLNIRSIASKVAVSFVVMSALLALMIVFGGPAPVAPMTSINSPFKGVDYSALPKLQTYTARDGKTLAYRHYAATVANPTTPANAVAATDTSTVTLRRAVLIHGSSASSHSMHTTAQALTAAGFEVDALDMRGHGGSGTHGVISYIGQLEDDVADFMKATPNNVANGTNIVKPQNILIGFSSGGGFTLRFAASEQAALFDKYILLSPFLVQAPTNRPSSEGKWASVGLPRIIALSILNQFGITRWNTLTTTEFALSEEAKKTLTSSYSYALMMNFAAHRDYLKDMAGAAKNLQLIVGSDDELMIPEQYGVLFTKAGKNIPITIVPKTGHIGMTLNPPALAAIVAAAAQ